MLDEPHGAIPWPALLVIVANSMIVCLVRVRTEDEVLPLHSEAEEDVKLNNPPGVQANGTTSLYRRVAVLERIIRHLRRACHLAYPLQSQD